MAHTGRRRTRTKEEEILILQTAKMLGTHDMGAKVFGFGSAESYRKKTERLAMEMPESKEDNKNRLIVLCKREDFDELVKKYALGVPSE